MKIKNKILSRLIRKYSGLIKNKKTFFSIFLFSIMTSCLILLLATVILYMNYQRASINEIHKKSLDQLYQTTDVFTSLNSLVISYARHLSLNPSIQKIIYNEELTAGDILTGISGMDSALTSNLLLHSIFVYNHHRHEYFSTIDGAEGNIPSDIDLPEILENIREYKTYNLIPRKMHLEIKKRIFSPSNSGIIDENIISMIVAEIPEDDNATPGALVLNISEEKMRNSFLSANRIFGGELIIIDGSGIVLSHPQAKLFGESLFNENYIKRILTKKEQSGVFVSKIGEIKHLVSYLSHPQMNWTFINITPYNDIFKEIKSFRNFSIILFIALILISAVLSLLFASRIYQPIQKLFQFAKSTKNRMNEANSGREEKNKNELQYMDEIFRQVVKKADDLDNYIESRKNKNIDDLLRDITAGNIYPDEINDEYFGNVRNFFDSKKITIAVLAIDRFRLLFKHADKETIKKWHEEISGIIDSFNEIDHISFIMQKGEFVIFFNTETAAEDKKKNIRDICLKIQNSIKNILDGTVSIGISCTIDWGREINEAYQAAAKALKMKFRYGNNSIIEASMPPAVSVKEYVYPEQKNNMLFNELKLGKMDRVEAILNDIFEEIRGYNFEDFTFMVQLLSYNILKMINGLENGLNYELGDCRKLIQNMNDFDTIEDVKEVFMKEFTQIVKVINYSRENKKSELAGTIKKYIKDKLFDPDLCPDKISSITDFSTQHIRNIFKDQTGTSLSDYINNLRIEHSKKLLNETSLTVKEISKNTGFMNYSYFFTSFKKHTGITPDIFRQKNKKY